MNSRAGLRERALHAGLWERAPQWLGSTGALAVLVLVGSWPVHSVAPTPGLDASSYLGLSMASAGGLDFGTEVIFSYGPLGFLYWPLAPFELQVLLAGLYSVAVYLALAVTLVLLARRIFGALAGAVIALLLLSTFHTLGYFGSIPATKITDPVGALAFIWCVLALSARAESDLARRLVTYAAGPLIAVQLLAKLNVGIEVAAMVAVTLIAMEGDRLRRIAIVSGSAAVTFCVVWLATGQGLDTILDYARNSVEIVSGNSSALALEEAGREWEYWGVLVIVAILFFAAWRTARGQDRRARIGMFVLVALFAAASFKWGFVRHDLHSVIFFSSMAASLLAFEWRSAPWALTLVCLTVPFVIWALALSPQKLTEIADPPQRAETFVSQLRTLLDSGRRAEVAATSRAVIQSFYAVDPGTLRLVSGHSVHVVPNDPAVAWGYGLGWRPLPVFQAYAAYTERLDDLNAHALTSADGPERLLRQSEPAVDGRFASYESPAAILAMLCNFESMSATDRWQVLARVPDRCSEPHPLEIVNAHYGEPIAVPLSPTGRDVVLARVEGLGPSGLERLRELAYKPEPRHILFDGQARYRLVAGTAANGLLMRLPAALDYPPPFSLGPNATTIEFTKGDADQGTGEIRVEFYSLPLRRK